VRRRLRQIVGTVIAYSAGALDHEWQRHWTQAFQHLGDGLTVGIMTLGMRLARSSGRRSCATAQDGPIERGIYRSRVYLAIDRPLAATPDAALRKWWKAAGSAPASWSHGRAIVSVCFGQRLRAAVRLPHRHAFHRLDGLNSLLPTTPARIAVPDHLDHTSHIFSTELARTRKFPAP